MNTMDPDTTYTGQAEIHTNQLSLLTTTGTFFESIQDNRTLHPNSIVNLTPEEQATGIHTTINIQTTKTMLTTHSEMLPAHTSLMKHTIYFQNLKQPMKKQKNDIYTSLDLHQGHLSLSSKQKEYPH
jgi:iron only hydrogenase large subunit-like protein